MFKRPARSVLAAMMVVGLWLVLPATGVAEPCGPPTCPSPYITPPTPPPGFIRMMPPAPPPTTVYITPTAKWSPGYAYCWGKAISGTLGDGQTSTDRATPSLVLGGFTDWTAIAVGESHTCGIRNGMAWCWGDARFGKLGDGQTTTNRTTPTLVEGGFADWTSISAGNSHTCGLRSNGTAWCWGYRYAGRLGSGATWYRTTPSLVLGGFTDWTVIDAGEGHTSAASAAGSPTVGGMPNAADSATARPPPTAPRPRWWREASPTGHPSAPGTPTPVACAATAPPIAGAKTITKSSVTGRG